MLFRSIYTLLMASALVPAANGATMVAPADSGNTNGNAQGPSPLRFYGAGGSRVQQAYDKSIFAGQSGPVLISAIQFRPYNATPSGLFGSMVSASDIQVRLSTTQKSGEGANPLSVVFAENTGVGSTLVYSGALALTTAASGPAEGPKAFDYTINLQTPYLYTPALGNLLLDVQIPSTATVSGNGIFGFLTFDTANTENDGLYSVMDINNGSALFGGLSTAGAITNFVGTVAVPEPLSFGLAAIGVAGLIATQRVRRVRS